MAVALMSATTKALAFGNRIVRRGASPKIRLGAAIVAACGVYVSRRGRRLLAIRENRRVA